MVETWQQVVFWFFAIVMTFSAVRVVTVGNVVHAALYLVVTLLGVASIYVLLYAEFLAWAQVIIYVGAVVVLLLFGLMLTRASIGKQNFDNDQKLVAAICAGLLFGVTSWIMVDAFEGQKINLARDPNAEPVNSTIQLGEALFTRHVLSFEVVGVVLLAALIGAVVIARKD